MEESRTSFPDVLRSRNMLEANINWRTILVREGTTIVADERQWYHALLLFRIVTALYSGA